MRPLTHSQCHRATRNVVPTQPNIGGPMQDHLRARAKAIHATEMLSRRDAKRTRVCQIQSMDICRVLDAGFLILRHSMFLVLTVSFLHPTRLRENHDGRIQHRILAAQDILARWRRWPTRCNEQLRDCLPAPLLRYGTPRETHVATFSRRHRGLARLGWRCKRRRHWRINKVPGVAIVAEHGPPPHLASLNTVRAPATGAAKVTGLVCAAITGRSPLTAPPARQVRPAVVHGNRLADALAVPFLCRPGVVVSHRNDDRRPGGPLAYD